MRDRHNKRIPSDAELVSDTLAGDRASFDVLVDRYRDRVFRLAYVKVRDRQEAEDLAQDAFVAAYQSLGQLRERDRFGGWLRRVAENQCNMRLRRNRPVLVPLLDDALVGEDPRQSLESRLTSAEITQALDALPETNRLAAVLFFVDGLAQREIAEFIDVPVTTVKRRINLARKQLRREMLETMKETLGPEKPKPTFARDVSVKIDVLRWYRRFSEYIDVGQNLVSTLARLEKEGFHETVVSETRAVKQAIQNGRTMTEAMQEHAPTLGIEMAVGMVRAGEIGGVLEHSARIIVSWLEMEEARARVDAAYWLRTLSFMLTAGVPLLSAVETMRSVPASGSLAELPDRLTQAIYNGGFADAFEGDPAFSDSTIALIRAGEVSGTLDAAMDLAASETIRGAYEQAVPTPPSTADAAGRVMEALRAQAADPSPARRLGALKALEHLVLPAGSGNASIAAEAAVGECGLASFISALSDSEAQVREFAARALERRPSRVAIGSLTAACDDAAPSVRKHALLALNAADSDAALRSLLGREWDQSPNVRRASVSVLAGRREPKAVDLLMRALEDPELLVARPASEALVAMGREVLPRLLASIRSSLPDIPEMAWEALRQIDANVARDVALEALSSTGAEGAARLQLINRLACVATAEDIPFLLQVCPTIPYGWQWEVSRAMGRLKAREAVPWLISLLDHPEPSVGWWAADALAKIGDPSAAAPIARRLEGMVATTSKGIAVGESASAVALKLVSALADLDASDYASAALSGVEFFKVGADLLARIAGPAEAKHMVELLGGDDEDLAVLAARFFAALAGRADGGRFVAGEVGATDALRRAAECGSPCVRNVASSALERLNTSF